MFICFFLPAKHGNNPKYLGDPSHWWIFAFPCLNTTSGLFLTQGVESDHPSPFRDLAAFQLPSGSTEGEVWPLFIPSRVNEKFRSGSLFDTAGNSNASILSSLNGKPGYQCVQSSSHTDVNTKYMKSSCKILYDVPDLPWLQDPPRY